MGYVVHTETSCVTVRYRIRSFIEAGKPWLSIIELCSNMSRFTADGRVLVYVENCRGHLRELTGRARGEREMVKALEMGTMKGVED